MVIGGRVVVLPAGVADAGGDDSGAVAQQFLRGPETAPGEDRGLDVLAHRGPSSETGLKINRGRPAGLGQRSRPLLPCRGAPEEYVILVTGLSGTQPDATGPA